MGVRVVVVPIPGHQQVERALRVRASQEQQEEVRQTYSAVQVVERVLLVGLSPALLLREQVVSAYRPPSLAQQPSTVAVAVGHVPSYRGQVERVEMAVGVTVVLMLPVLREQRTLVVVVAVVMYPQEWQVDQEQS